MFATIPERIDQIVKSMNDLSDRISKLENNEKPQSNGTIPLWTPPDNNHNSIDPQYVAEYSLTVGNYYLVKPENRNGTIAMFIKYTPEELTFITPENGLYIITLTHGLSAKIIKINPEKYPREVANILKTIITLINRQ